jgi:O-antigen ligase
LVDVKREVLSIRSLRYGLLVAAALSVLFWPYSIFLPIFDIRLTEVFGAVTLFLGAVLLTFEPFRLQKMRRWPLAAPAFFFGVLFLSCVFSPFRGQALQIVGAVLIAVAFVLAVDTRNEFEKVIIGIVLGMAALNLILMGIHLFKFHQVCLTPDFMDLAKGMSGKNRLAFGVGLFFPFAYTYFIHSKKAWSAVVFAVFAVSVVLVFSRMALYSGILILLSSILLLKNKKKYLIGLLGICLTAAIILSLAGLSLRDFLDGKKKLNEAVSTRVSSPQWILKEESSRVRYVKQAIRGGIQRPILGHGFNKFRYENPEYFPDGRIKRYPQTHNDYTGAFYEMGIVGLAGMAAVFITFGRRLWQARDAQTWIYDGLFLSGLSLVFMLTCINAYTTLPFWFLIGCGFTRFSTE